MARRRANGEGSLTKRKDGRWYARYPLPDGSVKGEYAKTQEEGAAKLAAMRERYGKAPNSLKAVVTLADYARNWLAAEVRPNASARTLTVYTGEVENHIIPRLGHLRLVDIQPEHIRAMVSATKEKSGPVAAKHALGRTRSMLNLAWMDGLLSRNPASFVKAPKAPPRAFDVWTEGELTQFVTRAEGAELYPMYYLALMTGLRPGEYLALRWCDIDEDEVRVRQTIKQPKGGLVLEDAGKTPAATRSVPLPSDAYALIMERALPRYESITRRRMTPGGFVFPSTAGTFYSPRNAYSRHWQPILTAAGLPHVRPYVTRHTFATMQIADGVDVATLARWMGHTDSGLTHSTYVHYFERRDRHKAKTLDELLGR